MSDDFEDWIPSSEAMQLLGVSRQRLWQIAHSGDWTRWPIRSIRVGRYWQYAKDDIDARAKGVRDVRAMYQKNSRPIVENAPTIHGAPFRRLLRKVRDGFGKYLLTK